MAIRPTLCAVNRDQSYSGIIQLYQSSVDVPRGRLGSTIIQQLSLALPWIIHESSRKTPLFPRQRIAIIVIICVSEHLKPANSRNLNFWTNDPLESVFFG